MKVLVFMVLVLFYSGCNSKQSSNSKYNSVANINIAKSGDFLFYAYMEDGKKLIRVSREKLEPKDNEEIIKVYRNGYYPNFDMRKDRCGYKVSGSLDFGNKQFCNSNYIGDEDGIAKASELITHVILAPIAIVSAATGGAIVIKTKLFAPDLLKKAIISSTLPKVKNIIFNTPILLQQSKEILAIDVLKHKFNSNQNSIQIAKNDNSEIILQNKKIQGNTKKMGDDVFKKVQNEVTSQLNQHLAVKDITLIPKIKKPSLPIAPKFRKSQFESKEMFAQRVKLKMRERELIIEELQAKYRKDVEVRNRLILKIENTHQSRLSKKNIEKNKLIKAGLTKYFNPYLNNLKYDAENSLLYADLKVQNFTKYTRPLRFKIPRDKAEKLYNKIKENKVNIYVKLKIKDETIELKNVTLNSVYVGILTKENFKTEKIIVALKDKKVNFSANELQNPNLKDKYQITGLTYIEDEQGRVNYKDDLPSLLSKASSTLKDSKKWLFVIGAEEYDNTDNVTYSKRSAETFVKVAKKSLGITDRNSYALIGNGATSGAIEDKLKLMLQNVKEGDSIYFYYSGHGIPVLPNRVPYILPKDKVPDFIKHSSFFKLNSIYNLLSNSKASKVIAIMDSCFSGSTDGQSVFKGVAGSVLIPKKVTFNHQKMVVLTAGRDKQFSNMYPKKGHRLFSYFVMKSLLEGKRSVKDVYNSVYPKVKSTSNGFGDLKRQEPTIEGNEGLRF